MSRVSPKRTAVMEQPVMLPNGFTIVTRYTAPAEVVVQTFCSDPEASSDRPGAVPVFDWVLVPEDGAPEVEQVAIDAEVAEQGKHLAALFPTAVATEVAA